MWWLAGLVGLVVYTIVKFIIFKPTKLPKPEKEQLRLSPIHSNFSNDIETIKEDSNDIKENCGDENSSDKEYLFTEKSDNNLVVDMNPSGYKIGLTSTSLCNCKDKDV